MNTVLCGNTDLVHAADEVVALGGGAQPVQPISTMVWHRGLCTACMRLFLGNL